MEDKLKFLKENVKVSLTVAAFGLAATLGYAKGCTVEVGKDPAPAAAAVAPVNPAVPTSP